jgi:hypothetical protein
MFHGSRNKETANAFHGLRLLAGTKNTSRGNVAMQIARATSGKFRKSSRAGLQNG